MAFIDRFDAGVQLTAALTDYHTDDVLIYALPRGGVAVAKPIAQDFNVPLNLLIIRKIGHPLMPEFALAAVTENGPVLTENGLPKDVDKAWFDHAVKKERTEAKRRRETYVSGQERVSAAGKTAIIVDDGLATGLTMKAAIGELRRDKPNKIIVAVPVAPIDTYAAIEKEADVIVCLHIVAGIFSGISAYYTHFPQLDDQTVIDIIHK